jgi:uncharacterized surface protein with fasciclin (FAS1) repeats
MNRLLTGLLTLALAFALTGCGRAQPTPTPEPVEPPTATPTSEPTATPEPSEPPTVPSTLLEIATAAGNFTTLLGAIEAADLNEKLNSEGPYTVFAPTDLAFEALPEGSLDDAETVYDILLFHIVEGKLMAADLADGEVLITLLGDELPVTVQGEEVAVGGAPIVLADIEATNGVIHVLESVLSPPSLAAAAQGTEASGGAVGAVAAAAAGAVDAAKEAGAEAAAAVESAAEAVEGAAAGAVAAAEGAAETAREQAAEAEGQAAAAVEGAVEAVEGAAAGAVAAAEGAATAARAAAAEATQPFTFEGPSIVDVAGENENFAVLLAAVQAAGLTDTLQSQGPFTVFAPTQVGFGALPQSVLEGLLREPAGALQALLLYHVAPGVIAPEDLAALDGQTLETAAGPALTVTVDEAGVISVDGVAISGEPVEAGNGLIYPIDGVLIPVME